MQWIPLSPQSSATLLRHRRAHSRDNVDQGAGGDASEPPREDDHDDDANSVVVPRRRFRKRRRDSDPSSNRSLVSNRRGGPVESDRSSSASEEEIEVLPDRFDTQGRPLGAGGPSRRSRGWTERRGDFEYRSPRPGGTQVRGMYGVAGTDPEHVERMMRDVSGVLAGEMPKGMGGWLGLAGKLLGGVVAPGALGGEEEEEGEDGHRGGEGSSRYGRSARDERDVVGYGGGGSEISRDERGKGRRRLDDHGYNDEDGEEEKDETRRRRRRRRREVD